MIYYILFYFYNLIATWSIDLKFGIPAGQSRFDYCDDYNLNWQSLKFHTD